MVRMIFLQIYFQRKRDLFFFFATFAIILLFLGYQMMEIDKKFKQMSAPDLVLTGKMDADNVIRFRYYKPIPGLVDGLKNQFSDEVEPHGLVMRNILTTQNVKTLEKLEYTIIGADQALFSKQIRASLKEGTLPDPKKKEAVIGSYAALHYQVKVGDLLPPIVSLEEELDDSVQSEYTVSGIINDDLPFFRGAVIVYRDQFPVQADNVVVAYFRGSPAHLMISEKLEQLLPQYPIGQIQTFFELKQNIRQSAVFTMTGMLATALLMGGLLISNFMKGMTRKIGLMKALGIPGKVLILVNFTGFGCLITASLLTAFAGTYALKRVFDHYMSGIYGFSVEYYQMDSTTVLSLLGLAGSLFAVLFLLIQYKSSKISPRVSMLDSN